jgi:MFS family permease
MELDGARWGRSHWLVFASTSAGFLLWGLITSLGYIVYPEFHDPVYIAVVAAMPLIGDIVLSRLSDLFVGRKRAFMVTMSLYAAGSLVVAMDVLYLSMNVVVFLTGYAIATFAVEGEVPVSLAYLAEVTPSGLRDRALVLATNFDNIGAAVAAAIAFIAYGSSSSYSVEALSIAVAALIALAAVAVLRSRIPESLRWLRVKGRISHAAGEIPTGASTETSRGPTVGFLGRYSFLAALGISQYITYGLMAFVVADYFFTGESLNFVVLAANAAASAAGLAVPLIEERLGSIEFALLSYMGGLLAMAPIIVWALHSPVLWAFYPLLALNMVFSEFAWATRIVYEPALFPTERRAFMVGLVRAAPIAAYSASAYLTSSLGEAQFLMYNAALWALGAAASIAWRLRGYDVSGIPLEVTGAPRRGDTVQ